MAGHEELFIEVGGAKVHYLKGGQGKPLFMLHSIEGNLGWRRYHEQLAEHFTVYAPTCPGFGQSERPSWLETFSDLARFNLWLLDELDLTNVALAGHFIGGWMAAEMAVMSPRTFDHLILVDAAGIQPKEGEIADIFLHGVEGTRQLAYFDPQQVPEYEELFKRKPSKEEREIQAHNQEIVVRYCWRPYMFSPSLPGLLGRVHVPTLIVWGQEDQIVPLECSALYQQALPNARVEIIPQCGNCPPLEKPNEFTQLVRTFLVSLEH